MKKVILLVLLGLVIGISRICGVNAEASQTNINEKCLEVKDFLLKNLNEFKRQYNMSYDDTLTVDSFEGYTLVYVIDKDSYALYIDFNDDNGYIITTFDFVVYELETKGDLEYLKNVSFAYYSILDGFLYKVDDTYYSYDTSRRETKAAEYGYEGQTSNGDGFIYNLEQYVADRYPSYTFDKKYDYPATISNYYSMTMGTGSYYLQRKSKDNGVTYPYFSYENCCAIVAATNVMYSWRLTNIIPQLPQTKSMVEIDYRRKIEWLYESYGTKTGGPGIESYWSVNESLVKVPEVYAVARDYAVRQTSYTPIRGCTADEIMATMIYTIKKYNLTIEPKKSPDFANVMDFLKNDRAVFLGISNSSTYGNHAVSLLGYYTYTYKEGWWVFETEKTAYFYIIDDGYDGAVSYFDPNTTAYPSFEFIYN